MSKEEITVVKSPIVTYPDFEADVVMYTNKVVYYVRLAKGMIATKPEDFPNKEEIEEEPLPESED